MEYSMCVFVCPLNGQTHLTLEWFDQWNSGWPIEVTTATAQQIINNGSGATPLLNLVTHSAGANTSVTSNPITSALNRLQNGLSPFIGSTETDTQYLENLATLPTPQARDGASPTSSGYMGAVAPWFFTHYGPDSFNKNVWFFLVYSVYLSHHVSYYSSSIYPINTYTRRDGSHSSVYEINSTLSKSWLGTIMESRTILDLSRDLNRTAKLGLMAWIIQARTVYKLSFSFFCWLWSSLAGSDSVLCNCIQDGTVSYRPKGPNLHVVSPTFYCIHVTRSSSTAYEFPTGLSSFLSPVHLFTDALLFSSKIPFGPSYWPPPLLAWPWRLHLRPHRHSKFLLVSRNFRCLFSLEVPWEEPLNVMDRLLLTSIRPTLRSKLIHQVITLMHSSQARPQIDQFVIFTFIIQDVFLPFYPPLFVWVLM